MQQNGKGGEQKKGINLSLLIPGVLFSLLEEIGDLVFVLPTMKLQSLQPNGISSTIDLEFSVGFSPYLVYKRSNWRTSSPL